MSELQDEIDKAKQPIVDMISPDLYFEYYLFRLQLDGYYILWVDISKEKKEIYIRAYHHDSRKKLYVAIAMDGHLIPVEEIEKMAADTDIMRCPIYSEHACKGIIDDMHLDSDSITRRSNYGHKSFPKKTGKKGLFIFLTFIENRADLA